MREKVSVGLGHISPYKVTLIMFIMDHSTIYNLFISFYREGKGRERVGLVWFGLVWVESRVFTHESAFRFYPQNASLSL